MTQTATIDLTRALRQQLTSLGERHKDLRAELEELRADLADVIRAAAAAGVPQKDIIEATGYTREAVRQIIKPKAREAANAARRKSA